MSKFHKMMERLKLSDKFAPKQVVTRSGTSTMGELPLTAYQQAAQKSRAAKLEQRTINRQKKIIALKEKEEEAKGRLGLTDDLSDSQIVINNFNQTIAEDSNTQFSEYDKNIINQADREEKEKMDNENIIKQVYLQDIIDLQKEEPEVEIIDTPTFLGTVQTSIGDERVTADKCELNPLYPLEGDEEGDMSCDRNVEKLDEQQGRVILEGPTTPSPINQDSKPLSTENYNKLAYALTDYRPLSNDFITINGTELQYPADLTNFIKDILLYIEKIIKYKIKRPKGSARNIKTLETYLQEKLTAVFKENSEKEKKERKKKKNRGESVTDDEQVLDEGDRKVIYRNIFNIKDTDIHTWKEDLEDYVYLDDNNETTNIPVKLSSSLILLICYYGVQVRGALIIYKVIKAKGQAEKIVRVGSVAEFPEIVECQNTVGNSTINNINNDKKCTFSYRINVLFNTIDTIPNNILNKDGKYNVIKSILLWFDTHHDFKKTRFKDVVDYWFDLNPKRFIDYYADQFFTGIGTTNITFSPSVENTILAPVLSVDNNNLKLATQLYTISVEHLREKDFEKTLLLIYITKYYLKPNAGKFTVNGVTYTFEGKHYLRDILNVKEADIETLVNTLISPNTRNEGYLKTISEFYGYNFNVNNLRSFKEAITKIQPNLDVDPFPYNFNIDGKVGIFINNSEYVKDAGSSSYKLDKEKRKYVPSALFDGNPTNSKELGSYLGNALYTDVINNKYRSDYNLTPILKNTYKYLYNNDCKLNVSINTYGGELNTIKKADIRCSKEGSSNPFEKTTDITLKQRIETMLKKTIGNQIRDKYTFSEKLLEVLKKYTSNEVGDEPNFANFAIQGNGTPLPLKYYFNNRDGPTVSDLIFVIIYTYIGYNGNIPLDVLDEILSLKRIGDYGQILDCKKTSLPLFTTDNMQCLISIFEKVSCFIDYSQGPGIIIYNGIHDSVMSRQVFNNIVNSGENPSDTIILTQEVYNSIINPYIINDTYLRPLFLREINNPISRQYFNSITNQNSIFNDIRLYQNSYTRKPPR